MVMTQFLVILVHFKTPGNRPNTVQDFFSVLSREMDSQIRTSKINSDSLSEVITLSFIFMNNAL